MISFFFIILALLKTNVVLKPVDCSGRRVDSSENANAFPSCVGGFEEAQSMSCGISKSWGDPAGA